MFDDIISKYNSLDKIFLRDKFIQSGGANGSSGTSGSLNKSDSISPNLRYYDYFLGLVVIVIGLIILNTHFFWKNTNATITKINCDEKTCVLETDYNINDKKYSRNFKIPVEKKDTYKISEQLEISYQKGNPNISEVPYLNYYMISIILIIVGFYFFTKKIK